jgi:hypothetical protein
MQLLNKIKNKNIKAFGLIEIMVLIIVIASILFILLNGMTTTAVVVKEVNNRETVKELATSYLNNVYKRAKKPEFYENMPAGDFPPIPLTSNYTGSGNFAVTVEVERESLNSKKVTITYAKPGATSFDDPILVYSTVIKKPVNRSGSSGEP